MARIRSIKPDFFKHHDLYTAEVESKLPLRIAFAGLWTCADIEGRFKWKPPQLKLDVLPYDQCDFVEVLKSLEKYGFIKKYSVGSEDFAFIPTFKTHQRITGSEATSESRIPSPPTSYKNKKGNIKETPKNKSGNYKDDREGKGREMEGKGRDIGRDIGREPENVFVFKMQKIYDTTWDEYRSTLNGQSNRLSEIIFIKWKEFVDFLKNNDYWDIFKCKFVTPIDFGVLITEKKFLENKWKDVIERILSVGVTPQQNLFFRIPQFMEYNKTKSNGKGTDKNITKHNAGALELLAEGKKKFNEIRDRNS